MRGIMKLKAEDKKQYSREGFIVADAILATAGDLPYKRGEFGLPGNPNETIMLTRSKDTLQKALESFQGKPVTINHPGVFLGTNNATAKSVGAVASIPTMDDDGNVRAKISVWDRRAISLIEGGQKELSPGFVFRKPEIINGKGKIENMALNHIAMVPKGRAGQQVRIMDAMPDGLIGITATDEDKNMGDHEKLVEAIRQAVDAATKSKSDVTAAVDAAVKPLIDEIAAIKAKDAKAESDAKLKEAQDAADANIKEAVDNAVDSERARYAVIQDAAPFIAEDKIPEGGLVDMEAKEVLKLAIGDKADGIEDVGVMKGILMGMKIAQDNMPQPKPQGSGLVKRGELTQATDARKDKYAKMYQSGRGKGA